MRALLVLLLTFVILAVQFHLEKSGRPGLQILRNFFDYCREVRHAQ